jgi:hypothetical protein
MDGRRVVVGLGSVVIGTTDVVFATGLLQIAGGAALLLGIVVCAWGVIADPPDDDIVEESIPAELPGRLCDHCGKMTSLDSSVCQHCGASLLE